MKRSGTISGHLRDLYKKFKSIVELTSNFVCLILPRIGPLRRSALTFRAAFEISFNSFMCPESIDTSFDLTDNDFS